MKRISIAAAIIVGSAAITGPALADPYTPVNPATDTIHVGLQIVDECTIDTTDIDFGSTGIIANEINAAGSVTIQCTHGTPYHIGLSAGHSGDTDDRTMTVGGTGDEVHYQLYSDSGYSNIWGNNQGVDTVDSAGATGADEVLPISAQIEPHQNVAPGNYADTITATIWYAGTYVTPDP